MHPFGAAVFEKFPRSYVAEILEQYACRIIRNMESGGTDSEIGGAHSAEGDQDSSETPHVDENDAFYEYSRKDIMENLCEIVFISVILHILSGNRFPNQFFRNRNMPFWRKCVSRRNCRKSGNG